MNFNIPLFVQSFKPRSKKVVQYRVRPLFASQPEHTDEMLGRATGRCISDLRKEIEALGREGKHVQVAKLAFNPSVEQHRLKLTIELRREIVKGAFAFFTFRLAGTRVVYSPSFPQAWFELRRGDRLAERAHDVVREELRKVESNGVSVSEFVEAIELDGKPWLAEAEFDADVTQRFEEKPEHLLAALMSDTPPDGAAELERVGRCLDRLYPQMLERAHLRDQQVEELSKLLRKRDRRPVLLVGPRLSGKTTLVHECVYRRVDRRGSAYQTRSNVWLLSPQRLISGMMYAGQWESRLQAIFRTAKKRDHVLYFDDLVGTFRAGVSRESNLSVAHLLKEELLSHNVRVLGEITPAQLRVLREQDRAFADAFHIIPVNEPDEQATTRILLSVVRRNEQTLGSTYDLDVLPTVTDLCRRYQTTVSFPGKAALILKRLSTRHKAQVVTRESVLADFHRSSGLNLDFLDDRRTLGREEIVRRIEETLVGQTAAVDAVADALTLAKARLNDPGRPLGCFLFVGPTGVGKTQCAKAVARTLFGREERMIRFDMNEYVSPFSVPQLVGTFDRPDGLLTSAVAREPFSIILLDELEKAHPDVFDLLLQMMGEGRLTDAVGRTVDFTNTLILMTSNIGARDAGGQVGYATQEMNRDGVYLRAVEEFFRPEFVNRLDRVVPFAQLQHAEVLSVARSILRSIATREGFQRRRCVISVSDDALEEVVREGFHPKWGARGVRRALERQLVRPAARLFSANDATTPAIIAFSVSDGKVQTHLCPLREADPVSAGIANWTVRPADHVLPRLRLTLNRISERVRRFRPEGSITAGDITAEQSRYLGMTEFLTHLCDACSNLEEVFANDVEKRLGLDEGRAVGNTLTTSLPSLGRFLAAKMTGDLHGQRIIMSEILSAQDIQDYVNELFANSDSAVDGAGETAVKRLLCLTAAAEAIGPDDDSWLEETVLLTMRGLPDSAALVELMGSLYVESFRFCIGEEGAAECDMGPERWVEPILPSKPEEMGFASPELREKLRSANCAAVLFRGHGLRRLLRGEAGFHLQIFKDGSIGAVRVELHEAESAEMADGLLREFVNSLIRVSIADKDETANSQVVRIYEADGRIVDTRTGMRSRPTDPKEGKQVIDDFVLAALPLPLELQEARE